MKRVIKNRDVKSKEYAKGGYVYRESDDEDATEHLTKAEAMEFIEEHNEMFDTNYKTIEDFNRGEQEANGIRSIEKMAKGGSTYSKGGEIKSKEYYIKAYDDRRERAVDEFSKENNGEKLEDIDDYIGNDFNAEEIVGSRIVWYDNPYDDWIEDMERSHSQGRFWSTDKEVTRILSNLKTK